ncbi:tricarballylate utilization 4Fe-4S protein TcuB [Pseudooceanicola sp. C21-150M6]|uniref:tricarballylate utilization 4Fe-4S protein TcuB n=1 Tax=Pseudooceanicola sp. C21-150M6 TaxID=3434355 RepID=UPI003D7F9C83
MLDRVQEARRQIEICNACRYCEGYCAVFPAITRDRAFAGGDITQLANLCHNCRGCYYACQYTEPHEFALNLPGALAEVRADSWERLVWPSGFARVFQRYGGAMVAVFLLATFFVVTWFRLDVETFYDLIPHEVLVAIFLPAFVAPLALIALALWRYWREVGGTRITWAQLRAALRDAARLKNLDGGQGQGCNFEREERYTKGRRAMHQAVLYGFLMCFASTCAGTVLHYAGWPAPYAIWSLPKLLGVPGGVLLTLGAVGLAVLKPKGDRKLGAPGVWGGEMGFVLLLGFTGASGLALYAARGTEALGYMMALHLGSVLTLFLLMPYSKMVHGFFRLAALVRDAQGKGL